jgi:hypothetical protein
MQRLTDMIGCMWVLAVAVICLPQLKRDDVEEMEAQEAAERGQF